MRSEFASFALRDWDRLCLKRLLFFEADANPPEILSRGRSRPSRGNAGLSSARRFNRRGKSPRAKKDFPTIKVQDEFGRAFEVFLANINSGREYLENGKWTEKR